ncbi:MAG: AMIN domain-containing protein [Gemmatimonadaceae bacterium]|nr:AMIN domain-containing protein [Gemmatimonadaceae bacterium]
MRRNISLIALAIGTLLVGAPRVDATPVERDVVRDAAREAAVTAVRVVPGAGRADVVLSFDGAIQVTDFTLTGPHRIVVDIAGATMQLRAPAYDRVSRAGITNVRLAQNKGYVRLVLDLDAAREYTVVSGEGELRVSVTGPDAFAHWGGGAAAVVADAPPADVVRPEPAVESKAAAPRFESKAQPYIASREMAPQQSQEPRVNFSFVAVPIREVLSFFSSVSGRSFVTGSTVTGSVTAEIVGQPWDIALSKILQSYGLSAVEDSTGIITVDSYKNLAARVASEPLVTEVIPINYAKASELAVTIRQIMAACSSGASGGSSEIVDVSAPPADAGAAPADAGAAPAGSGATGPTTSNCGRGTVAIDSKTNTIIITESVSRLPELVRYAKDLDVRTPQIAIRAKIISVDRTGTEALGLSYDVGSNSSATSNGRYCRLFICTDPNTGQPLPNVDVVVLGGDAFFGVANANRQFGQTGSLNLVASVIAGDYRLSAFLDALSTQELSDVQAEPSTTTIDNRKATLFAGQDFGYLLTPPPVPGQIQQMAATIARQEVGITLEVTPHVTANRQISMEIMAVQQSLIGITQAGPSINERRAQNEVLVADGETAVIAGLTQTQVIRTRSGIPYLMNLPYVGRLFSQTRTEERKQDLLILVTPHIVDEGEVVRAVRP